MNLRFIVLIAGLFLTGVACASDAVEPSTGHATTQQGRGPIVIRKPLPPGAMAARVGRLVDLNSATKAQLTKLPGISEADADRIIAARPLTSKADLATRKLLLRGQYEAVKGKVIAKPVQQKRGQPLR